MRFLLVLIVGIAVGVAAVWYFGSNRDRDRLQATGQNIENDVKSAGDTLQDKMRSWHLNREDITNDLAKSGRVIRDKAHAAGQAISDATADARITAAIKARLVRDTGLTGFNISVNTTGGTVTLSGAVNSPDDIGKAMTLAMDTDGVKQVISTLQLKPPNQ